MNTLTKGQYRVGVSFNPSRDPVVDSLKLQAASLIDAVFDIENENPEAMRLKALAATAIETAAMYAVKAQTKEPEA